MKLILLKKSKQKLSAMAGMQKLRDSLDKLGTSRMDDSIWDYSLKFFNAVVEFQDAGYVLDDEQYKKRLSELSNLKKHILKSGRNEYGWVRADNGEEVTLKNLYLGGVDGIWISTARTFKDSKDPDVKDAIRKQLVRFIDSHKGEMLKDLNKILQITKEPKALLNFNNKSNNTR